MHAKYTVTLVGAVGFLACATQIPPTSAAPLYDMNAMLQQSHPFYAAPRPAAPAPRTEKPGMVRTAQKSAPREPSDPPLLEPMRARGDYYATANLIGSWSTSFDSSTSLLGNPTVRQEESEVIAASIAGGMYLRQLGYPVRAEVELGYRYGADYDFRGVAGNVQYGYTHQVDTTYLLLNGYYDFELSGALRDLTPYLGLGVGIAYHQVTGERAILGASGTEVDTSTVAFAWQAGAGTWYALNDDWALNGGVRMIGLGTAEMGPYANSESMEANIWAIDVLLGVSYIF